MAQMGTTLAHTAFPLYSICVVGDRHFIVAGGGGKAKTGIGNAIVRVKKLFTLHIVIIISRFWVTNVKWPIFKSLFLKRYCMSAYRIPKKSKPDIISFEAHVQK